MSFFNSGQPDPNHIFRHTDMVSEGVKMPYDAYLNPSESWLGPFEKSTSMATAVFADVRTRTTAMGGPVRTPPAEAILFYTDKVKVGVGRVQATEGGPWMVFIQWPENMERVPHADALRLAAQITQYSKECDALNKKIALEQAKAERKAKRGRK